MAKQFFNYKCAAQSTFRAFLAKKHKLVYFSSISGGGGQLGRKLYTKKRDVYIYIYIYIIYEYIHIHIYLYIYHLLPLYRRTCFKLKNPMLYIGRKCTCIPDLREKAIYWHIARIWGLCASYRTCMRAISSENMRAGWVISGAITKTS